MNRLLLYSFCLGLGLSLTSCPGSLFNMHRSGRFQATPVNLADFNSETDDYNSNVPGNQGGQDYLIFSSKRDRKMVFNLVIKPLVVRFDNDTDQLTAHIGNFGGSYLAQQEHFYNILALKANQNCNVLGPAVYFVAQQETTTGSTFERGNHLLLYADDCDGNLQIKFVHNFNEKYIPEGPFEVSWLNSPQDDAYPTFTKDFSTLYFCSNRDGNFDIFEVALPTDPKKLLDVLLSDQPRPVSKNTILSTSADDKCPYLTGGWRDNDNVMYFVSDRIGGYGGFDIYYSKREKDQWQKPVNIGSRINTPFDEYRPITLRDQSDLEFHLGFFSSDRPGGKGGFDLYMVGFLKGEEIPYGN